MNADDTRQKLAKALAENARLRTDNDDLRRQISGLTGSRVWRMVNMLHRGLRWSIAWRGRVLRVISNPFRRVRNLMRFGAAEADAELLETCMVPTWSARENHWILHLDKSRFRKLQHSPTQTSKTAPPYVLKPVVSPNPSAHRPLVMHVIPNVYVGGSTQLIIDLIEHLSDRYDQEVITAALWRSAAHRGMVTHHFPNPLDEDALSTLLILKKPAIVHVYYWGLTDDRWYRAVLRAIDAVPCKIIENINTPIAPLIHRRVNHYIYVSAYVRDQFGAGANDPLTSSVIHPGIDLTRFDQPVDEAVTADAIGMVYRLEPDKLRPDSIQLFIEIARRRPHTKIYIIGGGSLFSTYVEQTKAAGVRENFYFTGYVPYNELPEWYGKFAIFVAPVWQESFGQVSVFSMNKKAAVAGFKIGALPEILGYDDTFGDDIASTTQKITDLLDDPVHRRRLGENNRRRAQEAFGVRQMTMRYAEIYDRLWSE